MCFVSSSSPVVLTLILATMTKQACLEEQVFVTKSLFVVQVIICLRLIIILSVQYLLMQSVKSLKINPLKTKWLITQNTDISGLSPEHQSVLQPQS